MTELKLELEQPPGVVFDSQEKNESQVIVVRPRRPFFRRLVRVLLVLGVGYYLFLLHLRLSTHRSASPRHEHPNPFKLAEDIFLSTPDAKSANEISHKYAGRPHLAGTKNDFATAELFLSSLQDSFGIQAPERKPIFDAGSHESQHATRGIVERETPSAWIDTYYTPLNTPLDRYLQIVDHAGRVIWDADLKEYAPEGGGDPDAAKYADDVPTFHGFSADGDVTGHLVNGDYCTIEEYDKLRAKRVPLKGSIVLCRYGAIARGLKIAGAQEHGAVGVLIYSDPRDDGEITVENGFAPYPEGPARNPTSVERGSVQLITYMGDPTTPGYPSYRNATRSKATNIPSIPSLPISWYNAKQLLQVLEVGSPVEGNRVRLVNNGDTKITPIWNVMGVIPGIIKNEVVVAGNHRDAWVLGAADPSSGTVSTHEVIRGFGRLLKKGWRPLRTIVIASWDAEEHGLIGSTEWGEDFADWIDKYVVAYFNLDASVAGSRFEVAGSSLLAHFIRDTAQDVPHPTIANRTLWDARNDDGILDPPVSSEKGGGAVRVARTHLEVAGATADDLGVGLLGSGSDFTVFLQRNGVPSTDGGFVPAPHDPVYHYHSVYDTVKWQERYGDPGFARHVAMAQNFGLQIMRLANAGLLPFNTTHYSLQLESYLHTVEHLPETHQLKADFGSLRSAIHDLQRASLDLDKEKHEVLDELRDIARRWRKHHKRQHKHHHRHDHDHKHDHDHDHNHDHDHGHDHKHEHQLGRKPDHKHKHDHNRKHKHKHKHHRHHRHHRHGHGHRGKFHIFNVLRMIADRVGAWFGIIPFHQAQANFNIEGLDLHPLYHPLAALYELASQIEGDEDEEGDFDHKHKHGRHDKEHEKWRKDVLRAFRHLQAVNKKLRSFEQGFISKDGIKGREWFKHLGVAPGKWLGYGATTLPALTEAIVFDKDKDAVRHEVKRLNKALDDIADKLR